MGSNRVGPQDFFSPSKYNIVTMTGRKKFNVSLTGYFIKTLSNILNGLPFTIVDISVKEMTVAV